jgi:hypothetical protein
MDVRTKRNQLTKRKPQMTTAAQDREFIAQVISGSLLEEAIAWIGKNLTPEEVFQERDLQTWAEDAGYTQAD